MENANDSLSGKELAYDLRQIYANLVGEHLYDVAQARKNNKYAEYFKNLDDVYVIIHHKFKDREKEEEKYKKLVETAVTSANKYEQEWLGKGNDSQGCATIEKSLREIEMFLYEMMEKANLFGKKLSDDDDEL